MNDLTLTSRFTPEVTQLHKLDQDIKITWHVLFIVCWVAIGLLVGVWLAYYYAHQENVTIINLQSEEIDKLQQQLNRTPGSIKLSKPIPRFL